MICGIISKKRGCSYKQPLFKFICEDDITFLKPEVLRENVEKFAYSGLEWDVVIIGGNNSPPFQIVNDCCCRIKNCQTTTGYIIRNHYYDVLIQNFRETVVNLTREPTNGRKYAIDIHWKILQKTGNWYMIIPPTVIQYENYSDIEKKMRNYNYLMLDMEKKWLYEVGVPVLNARGELINWSPIKK